MDNKTRSKLQAYSEALEELARLKSKDTFPNKDHQHAAIAISKIIKHSKENFILFDDDLKGDIVNNDEIVSFKDSLLEYISRGGKVKIVISDHCEDDDTSLKNFLILVKTIFNEQIELKLASPEFKEKMRSLYGQKINFAIGDNNKYRLESFGNLGTDEKKRRGKVSFNDQNTVKKLMEVFYSKYNTCINYN